MFMIAQEKVSHSILCLLIDRERQSYSYIEKLCCCSVECVDKTKYFVILLLLFPQTETHVGRPDSPPVFCQSKRKITYINNIHQDVFLSARLESPQQQRALIRPKTLRLSCERILQYHMELLKLTILFPPQSHYQMAYHNCDKNPRKK